MFYWFSFQDVYSLTDEHLVRVNLLITLGSSIDGARPKASVMNTDNSLWITKNPSKNVNKDIAAWEIVANWLAIVWGLDVASEKLQHFSNKYHRIGIEYY